MAKIIDKIEECPYTCEHCKHFVKGLTCAAFDIIPIEIMQDGAESHNHIFEGQKGNYIFEPARPRDTMRVYVAADVEPES